MIKKLAQISNKLVDCSLGKLSADLKLKNCNVLNTYSGEIMNKMEVAIYKDRVAFLGQDASHVKARKTVDLEGMFISTGLMDAHTHLDYLVSPTEFAKHALLHGTLTVFADPVDFVGVLGYKGFNLFLKEVRKLPIRVFTMVPMALPQDPKFSTSRYMNYQEVVSALENDDVLGLGEVLSWTRVIDKEKELFKIMKYALDKGKIINGHTAGSRRAKLTSYISAGISSCHEPINYDEMMERLRLGMWVMLREGSIRRDMEGMLSELHRNEINYSRLMMASDGVDPTDMIKIGYIDHCIRLCVKSGMHPAKAVQIASLNTATYYGLDQDLGGIAPGKLADIVVFNNLQDFTVTKVFLNGLLVVDNGKVIVKTKPFQYPTWAKNTINVKKKFNATDFHIKIPKGKKIENNKIQVIISKLQTDVITRQDTAELAVINNNVRASKEDGIWKIAVIDRHNKTDNIGLGFVKGFKTDINAFGGTINVCENQLVILGTDEEQMAITANTIIDMKGGIVATKEGKILVKYQMDIAGIMSSKSYEEAFKEYEEMNTTFKNYGYPFDKPLNILLFATFLALPEVRFTNKGMVNVKKREYTNMFA
ncbi:MAG: adenine deaminase [Thaumarchaeota archaeon]|nr:adenine deaminase [Nitrososphaerota archaeon]